MVRLRSKPCPSDTPNGGGGGRGSEAPPVRRCLDVRRARHDAVATGRRVPTPQQASVGTKTRSAGEHPTHPAGGDAGDITRGMPVAMQANAMTTTGPVPVVVAFAVAACGTVRHADSRRN